MDKSSEKEATVAEGREKKEETVETVDKIGERKEEGGEKQCEARRWETYNLGDNLLR